MSMAYWMLVFLYVALVLLYSQSSPDATAVEPWPVLSVVPPETSKLPSSCRTSADCPAHHACIQSTCVPKLWRGGECDAANGAWEIHLYRGVPFAVCTCRRPHIYRQKFFGGDCDVRVACGVHGRWHPDTETCTCDPGYRPGPNYTCERAPVLERMAQVPCGPGEIEVERIRPEDGFHPDYVRKLRGVKCVSRPCTFDALSDRPLGHGVWAPDWGCLCDPRYGLFGVYLEGEDKKYLRTPGPDACASIYKKVEVWTEVELHAFYYLDQRPPLSFIKFHVQPGQVLQSPLRDVAKDDGIIVGQQWPYTYMQHVLEHEPLAVRTRECRASPNPWLFGWERCEERLVEYPYRRIACGTIDETKPEYGSDTKRVRAYRKMYRYPVCFVSVDDNDPNAANHSMFAGKTILNPYLLTYDQEPKLFRTNEMIMTFSDSYQSWFVDFGDGYRVDAYKRMDTNAPSNLP